MRSILLCLIIVLVTLQDLGAQKRLDSLLNTLKNADLFIYPILMGSSSFSRTPVEIRAIEARNKNKLIKPFRKNCRIISIGITVEDLLRQYSLDSISVKLLALFDDEKRDLYAHAILTEIFYPNRLLGVMKLRREDWRTDCRKEGFFNEWKELFIGLGFVKPSSGEKSVVECLAI